VNVTVTLGMVFTSVFPPDPLLKPKYKVPLRTPLRAAVLPALVNGMFVLLSYRITTVFNYGRNLIFTIFFEKHSAHIF
jgi:hypothetical protein